MSQTCRHSVCLHIQELQTSSYHTQEAAAKDARCPKFRARNRYADVSPCKCWAFLYIGFSMVCLHMQMNFYRILHFRGIL